MSNKNVAEIKLAKALDYETITEYSLIVRVQNKYQLAAETTINIEIEDVNDNIPVFRELTKGSVLENEPEGSPVMQVRAIDADGTTEHNQVNYFAQGEINQPTPLYNCNRPISRIITYYLKFF